MDLEWLGVVVVGVVVVVVVVVVVAAAAAAVVVVVVVAVVPLVREAVISGSSGTRGGLVVAPRVSVTWWAALGP